MITIDHSIPSLLLLKKKLLYLLHLSASGTGFIVLRLRFRLPFNFITAFLLLWHFSLLGFHISVHLCTSVLLPVFFFPSLSCQITLTSPHFRESLVALAAV